MAATVEEALQQERDTELESFSAGDAFALGMKVLEIAGEQSRSIVVSVRRGGKLLFYKAGADTAIGQDDQLRRRTNAVNLQGHSSLYLHMKYNGDKQIYCQDNGVNADEYAIEGGCFPVKLRNHGMVGTVAVSGLNPKEDHLLCIKALFLLRRQQDEAE